MDISLDAMVENLVDQQIGEPELVETWTALANQLGLNAEKGKEIVLATARDATSLATDQLDPAFGGGWQWDLSDGTVRTIMTSTLLMGVLAAAGVSGLIPLVVPAVLPLLFDLKRVRLERSAERIIKIFGAKSSAFERIGSPVELYNSLPGHIRDVLSLDEFTGFLEDAVRAGQAEEDEGIFEILRNGDTVLKVTIR